MREDIPFEHDVVSGLDMHGGRMAMPGYELISSPGSGCVKTTLA